MHGEIQGEKYSRWKQSDEFALTTLFLVSCLEHLESMISKKKSQRSTVNGLVNCQGQTSVPNLDFQHGINVEVVIEEAKATPIQIVVHIICDKKGQYRIQIRYTEVNFWSNLSNHYYFTLFRSPQYPATIYHYYLLLAMAPNGHLTKEGNSHVWEHDSEVHSYYIKIKFLI